MYYLISSPIWLVFNLSLALQAPAKNIVSLNLLRYLYKWSEKWVRSRWGWYSIFDVMFRTDVSSLSWAIFIGVLLVTIICYLLIPCFLVCVYRGGYVSPGKGVLLSPAHVHALPTASSRGVGCVMCSFTTSIGWRFMWSSFSSAPLHKSRAPENQWIPQRMSSSEQSNYLWCERSGNSWLQLVYSPCASPKEVSPVPPQFHLGAVSALRIVMRFCFTIFAQLLPSFVLRGRDMPPICCSHIEKNRK